MDKRISTPFTDYTITARHVRRSSLGIKDITPTVPKPTLFTKVTNPSLDKFSRSSSTRIPSRHGKS